MWGGEMLVPKIPSYNILDLAEAIDPNAKIEIIGIRPGEKLHEELITITDAINTIDFKEYYVLLPNLEYISWDRETFINESNRWTNISYSYTKVKFISIIWSCQCFNIFNHTLFRKPFMTEEGLFPAF